MDRARILPDADEQRLDATLALHEQRTSDQVVVVTVPSLDGKDIDEAGTEMARAMKIGRADLDNGVLLLVAASDRKVRIDVGTGLEDLLTDVRAAHIVQDMIPHFRNGDMPGGVTVGVDEITGLLREDRRRPRYRKKAA